MWAMLALLLLCPRVLSCWEVARGVRRAHLGWGIALSRALRVRGVEHSSIVRRGGGGGRRGGERRALHDPIVLTIVARTSVMCEKHHIRTNFSALQYPCTITGLKASSQLDPHTGDKASPPLFHIIAASSQPAWAASK